MGNKERRRKQKRHILNEPLKEQEPNAFTDIFGMCVCVLGMCFGKNLVMRYVSPHSSDHMIITIYCNTMSETGYFCKKINNLTAKKMSHQSKHGNLFHT